jgi:Sulfotransferase family
MFERKHALINKGIVVFVLSVYAYFCLLTGIISEHAVSVSNGWESQEAQTFEPLRVRERSAASLIVQPRAFGKRAPDKFPCFPQASNSTWWKIPPNSSQLPRQGFFFLRTHKTGSSTCVGVHLRIARSMAATSKLSTHGEIPMSMCRVQFEHATARQLQYAERSRENSFLWTAVRDPTQRAISHFFHFGVSRRNIAPTDKNFQQFLSKNSKSRSKDYYLRMLLPFGSNRSNPRKDVERSDNASMFALLQAIIDDYDFIAVSERMDESLVALQMILGLKTKAILYLTSKSSGGYDAGGFQNMCTYIQPKNVSEDMKTYFRESPVWEERTRWDRLLWDAANKCLDRTIEALGPTAFQKNLATFQQARQVAQTQCLPNVIFPCSAARAGLPPLLPNETDCLWRDTACGTTCLDQVPDKLGIG